MRDTSLTQGKHHDYLEPKKAILGGGRFIPNSDINTISYLAKENFRSRNMLRKS